MASRAEAVDGGPAVPSALGVRGALRRAVVDSYYQSIRLVPANVAWGIVFVVFVFMMLTGWWPPALLAAGLLGVAWIGVVRLAVLIARRRDLVLSDVPGAWRRWLVPGLVVGSLFAVGVAGLWVNVLVGLSWSGLLGWSLATLAGWGLVLGWLFALAFWPILLDPERDGIQAREAARLAALLVLARPFRMAILGGLLGAIAIVSTVLMAAIITVSAAFIAVAAAHFVLPAADDLEDRLARR